MNKLLPILAVSMLLGSMNAFSVVFTGTGIAYVNSNASTLQAGFVGNPVYVIGAANTEYELNYTSFAHSGNQQNTFTLANSTEQIPSGLIGSSGIYSLYDLTDYRNVTVGSNIIKVYPNESFALFDIGIIPANVQRQGLNATQFSNSIYENISSDLRQVNSSLGNRINLTNKNISEQGSIISGNVMGLSSSLSSLSGNLFGSINSSLARTRNITSTLNGSVNERIDALTSNIPANTATQLGNLKSNLTYIVSTVNKNVSQLSTDQIVYWAIGIVISVAIAVLLVYFVLPAKAPPDNQQWPPYNPPYSPKPANPKNPKEKAAGINDPDDDP